MKKEVDEYILIIFLIIIFVAGIISYFMYNS